MLQQNIVLIDDTLSDSRMTACKHANGRDWWLVNHEYNTNKIYTNLITPDSIYGPFYQNIGAICAESDAVGWSLFSQNGSLFATVTGGMGKITLLDFDRCTGSFSNYRFINLDSLHAAAFLAISPSGRFLYACNNIYLYQYDLDSPNIDSSCVTVATDTPSIVTPRMGMMVLMPDSKIYQAGWTCCGDCISVIDSPDLKAPACHFRFREVCIPNVGQVYSAPNFPNYNLGALIGSGCDTLTGINKAKNQTSFAIYPNPFTSDISISLQTENLQTATFTITNIIGQTIYHHTETNVAANYTKMLDLGMLPQGVYFVTVQSGGVSSTKKLVKQ